MEVALACLRDQPPTLGSARIHRDRLIQEILTADKIRTPLRMELTPLIYLISPDTPLYDQSPMTWIWFEKTNGSGRRQEQARKLKEKGKGNKCSRKVTVGGNMHEVQIRVWYTFAYVRNRR